MRKIDADELLEHVWRDKLDSREAIEELVKRMPTVNDIWSMTPIKVFNEIIEHASNEKALDELITYLADYQRYHL